MTAQRMRQHIGAVIFHARQALAEAPQRSDVPEVIVEIARAPLSEDVRAAGVDEGHVREHQP